MTGINFLSAELVAKRAELLRYLSPPQWGSSQMRKVF
jgi:hypothetical protein